MKRLLLTALVALPAWAGVILEGSTDALELNTSAAGSIDYNCSWSNVTATALTTPGTTKGNITTAAQTVVVVAPAAANFRHVRACTFYNAHATASNTVTVQRDVSATNRLMFRASLAPGESLVLGEDGSFNSFDVTGRRKTSSEVTSAFNGLAQEFYKIGVTKEAIGVGYAWLANSGTPGAWVPGTPGLNGATTDCSTGAGATIAGAPLFPAAASGSLYLTYVMMQATVTGSIRISDLQWYNTGLVVTTTTNQAITFPTPVSRDDNLTNLGAGISAGIFVTTATTNAGAITNTTLSYTNESGTAGRSATMASFPATAVAGTIVEFQLQAGDRGVRSIEGVTLGTSYVSGAISLVTFRSLTGVALTLANIAGVTPPLIPGVKIGNGTCLLPRDPAAVATTLQSISGVVNIMER